MLANPNFVSFTHATWIIEINWCHGILFREATAVADRLWEQI
jgi:hypothetical protein